VEDQGLTPTGGFVDRAPKTLRTSDGKEKNVEIFWPAANGQTTFHRQRVDPVYVRGYKNVRKGKDEIEFTNKLNYTETEVAVPKAAEGARLAPAAEAGVTRWTVLVDVVNAGRTARIRAKGAEARRKADQRNKVPDDRGIGPDVARIVRTGDHPNLFLRNASNFLNLPWIENSNMAAQTTLFIGADGASLCWVAGMAVLGHSPGVDDVITPEGFVVGTAMGALPATILGAKLSFDDVRQQFPRSALRPGDMFFLSKGKGGGPHVFAFIYVGEKIAQGGNIELSDNVIAVDEFSREPKAGVFQFGRFFSGTSELKSATIIRWNKVNFP
jgi:hypothetical protein